MSGWTALCRHWRLTALIVGALLGACGAYCVFVPRQFEAHARLALRSAGSPFNWTGTGPEKSGNFASGQIQLETLADVLRSDQLARQVIRDGHLYAEPAFMGRLMRHYRDYRPEAAPAFQEAELAERFARRLHVVTLPRTLVLEIRFRSRDPVLSARVVNLLVSEFQQEESASRVRSARAARSSLTAELDLLKNQAQREDRRLAEFQRKHRILGANDAGDRSGTAGNPHASALVEVDQLSRELAAVDAEIILRQAQERAAAQGDPEAILAFDAKDSENAELTGPFRSLHTRREQLEQELAQLSIERGPNFPRVVEVRRDLQGVKEQLAHEDAVLRERFGTARRAAEEHAVLVRRALETRLAEGLRVTQDLAEFETLRREADATHELYLRMQDKVAEASLASGAQASDVWVIDDARPPAKPVVPNPPLALAITLFGALWIGAGAAFIAERMRRRPTILVVAVAGLLQLVLFCTLSAQAPTPSTSGLPTGVARLPQSRDTRATPDLQDAPPVWGMVPAAGAASLGPGAAAGALPLSIGPGDVLEVSEFHTPEFHTVARVNGSGTVKLPLVDEVRVAGLDELAAARAIAAALLAQGMLNHPQVFVLVTAYAGQDVSILGEVAKPGVYPYGVHHRLLDLLSAASGVTPYAGEEVNIYHREDPATPHIVRLLRRSDDPEADHNPELAPGDLVQVSRAGLVYVVGDVIRPGGFVLEPSHELTVLKALSLAWGPSQNAALTRAILIHEQPDGRLVSNLNLKRMLRGQDPDEPVHDHDILFVPNSAVKNLFNRSVEAAIQSAAGVSIYAGLVYSQRF